MTQSIGQNKDVWTSEWRNRTPESEIQMWDYFGLRPWIMKYTPRFGKVIEAGCGLGRYVFLLDKFGIDIEGIDFSKETIELLEKWKSTRSFRAKFKIGDITQLPYNDNSISGYLSFGVIEHFIEGPQKPLEEAYRVLQPGGIAIISTPSKSWFYHYYQLRYYFRSFIKKIIGRKIDKKPFFQYWYSPKQLKTFIEAAGFTVSRFGGSDMLYTIVEFCRLYKIKIENHKWLFRLAHKLDKTFLSRFGAQALVIAVKPGEVMQCFFCGNNTVRLQSLEKYDVPTCEEHKLSDNTKYYKKENNNPAFREEYLINPKFLIQEKRKCNMTQNTYTTDPLFENFGLSIDVHPEVLKIAEHNIKISNLSLQPIWRSRTYFQQGYGAEKNS